MIFRFSVPRDFYFYNIYELNLNNAREDRVDIGNVVYSDNNFLEPIDQSI